MRKVPINMTAYVPFAVQFLNHVQHFATPLTTAKLPFTVFWSSNSCPLSQRSHPTISSSVSPLLLLPSIFPSINSFPVSQLFASGGQIIGSSALASVLPMNIQGWFPLILLFKGLSRVFSSTTVQKHQFFDTLPSLWSNSHIHSWLLGKTKQNKA